MCGQCWWILLSVLALTSGELREVEETGPYWEYLHTIYIHLRDVFLRLVGRTTTSRRLLGQARSMGKLQPEVDIAEPFPCNVTGWRSLLRPSSVHRLRPGDIDVVGAMGDSLTAGNGAASSNMLHTYSENRGISWSIGGQGTWRQYLTLPNILKEFNPHLVGFSLADSFSHHKASQFNVGELGAMSRDLPFMAKELVKRIKNDRRVDFKNDWKLITMMIGSNDFCLDICFIDYTTSHENHLRDLITTLDYLQATMPHTLVNLVVAPNLGKIITRFTGTKPACHMTHSFECPCLFGLVHQHQQIEFVEVMSRWQNVELQVASDKRYQWKDDFAVVAQPFTMDLVFPTRLSRQGRNLTDFTYLAEDCFHFSQKGYSRAANAVWNNMMEMVGRKSSNWEIEFSHFLCPSATSPYIYTAKNS